MVLDRWTESVAWGCGPGPWSVMGGQRWVPVTAWSTCTHAGLDPLHSLFIFSFCRANDAPQHRLASAQIVCLAGDLLAQPPQTTPLIFRMFSTPALAGPCPGGMAGLCPGGMAVAKPAAADGRIAAAGSGPRRRPGPVLGWPVPGWPAGRASPRGGRCSELSANVVIKKIPQP